MVETNFSQPVEEDSIQEAMQQQDEETEYPLDPLEEQHVRTIEIDETTDQYAKGNHHWYFIYTEQQKMLGSNHLDKVQKHLGIQTVPEMLFG